jgi:acyl-CoA synthetase (AMP-forming)/AMP-acid ligase II
MRRRLPQLKQASRTSPRRPGSSYCRTRRQRLSGAACGAVVVLADGTDLTDIELRCRAQLAAFKVPSTWELVADLPKTSIGKIDKQPLRERVRTNAPPA